MSAIVTGPLGLVQSRRLTVTLRAAAGVLHIKQVWTSRMRRARRALCARWSDRVTATDDASPWPIAPKQGSIAAAKGA